MVESLTGEIEAAVEGYLQKIDAMGGALAAIEQGFPQREIQESSYRYQKDIEEGGQVVIGVNKFGSAYPRISGLLQVSPEEARKQIARLNEVKRQRRPDEVASALEELKRVAGGSENTMPAFIRCAEAYATVGEICATLREVFGVQREYVIF
jgi:methylmalonyl-CoA mutase N-terminal domain/subunit